MQKRLYSGLGLLLAGLLLLVGCAPTAQDELTVTLCKVGKADAIVVQSGGETLLIDTGETEDGAKVAALLQSRGVTAVKAMIVTHFDKDHVGGAADILAQFAVGTVYTPDYVGTRPEYADFVQAAEAARVPVQRLTEPVTFTLGTAQVLVEPPETCETPPGEEPDDNNFSLITTITHGENRLAFLGDAEKKRIRQWLAGDSATPCDFLKVPHHGRYNGALEELFQTLSPEVAVICSSNKHPAEARTLELLAEVCPQILQTKDGTVTVTSDGSRLQVQQAK